MSNTNCTALKKVSFDVDQIIIISIIIIVFLIIIIIIITIIIISITIDIIIKSELRMRNTSDMSPNGPSQRNQISPGTDLLV